VDDEIGSSGQDAPKKLLVNLISVPGIPKNGKLVGRFKRLNFCDVLADFPDRSGMRREGRKKETEEQNQAFLQSDAVKECPIPF
jgi:hypothetical protein